MAKYSIILPVRNGGEYVKDCIKSILAQTYSDFSLVILDNNSTDGTLEWVRSLQDTRILIYASDVALSIEKNWGRVINVPQNEFITLIGHDDLLHENYLETMDSLIDKFPNASLYQTHFNYIDAKGAEIRKCLPMVEVESGLEFLQKVLTRQIDIMGTGFLIRSKDYKNLGGMPKYPSLLYADFELWLRSSLLSFKATSKSECFSFRIHQSTTSGSLDSTLQESFGMFIKFLNEGQKKSLNFDKVIKQYAGFFLAYYCKSLSHRLLRTPFRKRGYKTVRSFVKDCENYATLLGVRATFRPNYMLSIVIAKAIDSNPVSRSLFLCYKKMFPKPLMK